MSTLTPERYAHVCEWFERLAGADPATWEERLRECENEGVREAALRMLRADDRTLDFPGLAGDEWPAKSPPVLPVAFPPSVTFAHYRDLEKIGEGGMGVVYRALDERLRREVALKTLRRDGDDGRELLLQEARAAAALDREGIVPVHAIDEHDGQPYIAMAYVPGKSLKDRLEAGRLPPRDAARLVLLVAKAIGHAHTQAIPPIVHRDLKPANVLLDHAGRPWITDFGIAKRVEDEDHTFPGEMFGTPRYMSPEQALARNKEVTPASDVFAIGVVLYEMLTGRVPFDGPTTYETLKEIIEKDPTPPRQIVPEIPRDLETICLRCLRKDPQERFANGVELSEELERYLAGDPLRSRSYTSLELLLRNFGGGTFTTSFNAWKQQAVSTVLILLAHLSLFGVLWARGPEPLAWFAIAWFTLPALFALRMRGSQGLLPSNPAERLVWAIWLSHAVAIVVGLVAYRIAVGDYVEGILTGYPMLAVTTGMAYLVTGAGFSPVNCAFGVLFLATAPVLPFVGLAGPLMIAAEATVANLVHLRNMYREAANF